MLAACCSREEPSDIVRSLETEEAASLLRCADIVDRWLERFVEALEPSSGNSREMDASPRNRAAYEQGQLVRQEIRGLLERHPPTAPPLRAKQIIPQLSRPLSERTVQWHLRNIRLETLRSTQFNSLPS
jgi:hypothetical protein